MCVAVVERSGRGLGGRERETVLSCTESHINICHSTLTTEFRPSSVEMCEETFKAKCGIVMRREAANQTVRHCSTSPRQFCPPGTGGSGNICQQHWQTSCVTR